jgi:hypothetical protein
MEGLSNQIRIESEKHDHLVTVVEQWDQRELVMWVDPIQTRRPPANIWWGCPCIKKMIESPCSDKFKEVEMILCFLYFIKVCLML